MLEKKFELNQNTIPFLEMIGEHIPGGFVLYRSEQPEELIYANKTAINIFGCSDIDEFKELTGFTFRGMVHPDDYASVSKTISEQITKDDDSFDHVEYRIVRKDGAVRWLDDYGHYTVTKAYGGVYYVFISDITEKKQRIETGYAARRAVLEALSKSYHTVLIIKDVETESFSLFRGDVKGDTVHFYPLQMVSPLQWHQVLAFLLYLTM